mmetsp:Transcript_72257/g.193259  ORF Transcript_72257/g.193259 Transcript_72257/m.193259 type:complete len:217 (+) Transcript_72257:952-1602(+)
MVMLMIRGSRWVSSAGKVAETQRNRDIRFARGEGAANKRNGLNANIAGRCLIILDVETRSRGQVIDLSCQLHSYRLHRQYHDTDTMASVADTTSSYLRGREDALQWMACSKPLFVKEVQIALVPRASRVPVCCEGNALTLKFVYARSATFLFRLPYIRSTAEGWHRPNPSQQEFQLAHDPIDVYYVAVCRTGINFVHTSCTGLERAPKVNTTFISR